MPTTPTTDRHPPLRMDHVVVLGTEFTQTEKRRIARAFNGQTSNKAQAAAEGVSPSAIEQTWVIIADRMRLPFGKRTRQHTMAELCRRHLVEFLCMVLIVLPTLAAINVSDNIDMRTRRGGRSRRGRGQTTLALDIDTISDITDWPAWLDRYNRTA